MTVSILKAMLFCFRWAQALARSVQSQTLLSLLSNDDSIASLYVSNATQSLQQMLSLEEELYLGAAGFDSMYSDPRESTLMLSDGCQGSSRYDECIVIFDGLFSRGLHAVVQEYSDVVTNLLTKRSAMSGAVVPVAVSYRSNRLSLSCRCRC